MTQPQTHQPTGHSDGAYRDFHTKHLEWQAGHMERQTAAIEMIRNAVLLLAALAVVGVVLGVAAVLA